METLRKDKYFVKGLYHLSPLNIKFQDNPNHFRWEANMPRCVYFENEGKKEIESYYYI